MTACQEIRQQSNVVDDTSWFYNNNYQTQGTIKLS